MAVRSVRMCFGIVENTLINDKEEEEEEEGNGGWLWWFIRRCVRCL